MENNINNSNDKVAYPLLGIPKKVGKAYLVKDHALVGLIYTIVCPQCHKHLLVKAASSRTQKKTCSDCGAEIYFPAKARPVHQEAPKERKNVKEEENGCNPTHKYNPSHKVVVDNETSKTVHDEDRETKENVDNSGNSGTVKFGTPNAKIVWGSIFNRKTFEIRVLGEYYIGRDDDELKSDIVIKDDYVSRQSVLLEVIPKGGKECLYKITVKHASNPVLVNGKEIAIGESAYLNYGDTILVGNTTLTFKRNNM